MRPVNDLAYIKVEARMFNKGGGPCRYAGLEKMWS